MKVYIIAEAGVNHNGSIAFAKQMVNEAWAAGADCIKFQTFIAEKGVSKFAEMAEYQKENTGSDTSQYEMVKKLELSFEQFKEIQRYCGEKNILFLSTPFDLDSIDFLQSIDIPFWKIPSGEITNLPYLLKIAQTGKDIILSTDMCNMDEIRQAVEVLQRGGAGEITLLHCTTEYPTPFENANLKAMLTLRDEFGLNVGYSDHTQGIEAAIAAAALGAAVIEKDFTLDKNMEGPDHKASLEPDEFRQMVKSIRNIEKALGDGEKKPGKSEIKNIAIARKSIIAKE